MDIFKVEVDTFGGSPVATHNVPCAVCQKGHAILEMHIWVFSPCWRCQANGWKLEKRQKPLPWWKRIFS